MSTSNDKKMTYGFGLLSIALISRWITGNAIFTSSDSFLHYGYIGAITFSAGGFLAFLALIPILMRVRRMGSFSSLPEVLASRLSPAAFLWMNRLLIFGVLCGIIVMGYAAAILLYPLHIPIEFGISAFFLIGFPIAVFTRIEWFTRYSMLKVGGLFLLMIMMLVHAYMLEGIEKVYDGLRLYHPYLLYINWPSVPMLLTVFFLAMLGHMLIDQKMWNLLLRSRLDKIKLGMATTGFIWSTIPFSFSMISMSAIYLGGFHNLITVFEKIILRYDSRLLAIFLIVLLLFILFESFLGQMHSLYVLYNKNDRKLKKHIWLLFIFYTAAVPFLIYYFALTILDLFFIFGCFFASVIPAVLRIFWSQTRLGKEIIFAAASGTLAGWTALGFGLTQNSILIAFIVSLAFLLAAAAHLWLIPRKEYVQY